MSESHLRASDSFDDGHRESHDWDQIESVILSASNYVQPSSDLRPRTLEAARQWCGDRRAEKKLGGFVIAILLFVLIGSPASHFILDFRSRTAPRSPRDMHDRAVVHAAQPGIGIEWGMAEAFTELRQDRASQLGHNDRFSK